MASGTLDLFENNRETGFDGQYETTTRYRLVGNEGEAVTMELEIVKRTTGDPDSRTTYTRYTIGARPLAELIEKHGEPQR